jgi:glycerol-3-phosphate dehydrogenase
LQRDLASLADGNFDLVVIGGGIVGASIARDAARRGLAVALVEKEDFGAATSEAMSHMVHGGIRYLAHGDVPSVRTAIAERAVWRRIAPHQIALLPCMAPLTGGLSHRLALRVGVMLFDALGGRNVLEGGQRVPLAISRASAVHAEPAIEQPGLTGALLYHDCRVDEPERVVLGVVKSAVHAGAVAANHLECTALVLRGGRAEGVEVRDRIGGAGFAIPARSVVNATGAWSGAVASRLLAGQQQAALTLSKGIHLVVEPVARHHSLTLAGNGEHGFVLPWRGMSLVGTTDDVLSGDPGRASVEPADVEQLADKLGRLLPAASAALARPLASFAGVRALPGNGADTYRMSRDGAASDHAADGAARFFSVFGGKWTTARLMAEGAVDRIATFLQRSLRPSDTAAVPLEDAPEQPVDAFVNDWRARLDGWKAADVVALAGAYGRAMPEVLACLPGTGVPPDSAALETARFAHAVAHEMAVTPEDLARRLARWHSIRHPGVVERAAAWLATRGKLTHVGRQGEA